MVRLAGEGAQQRPRYPVHLRAAGILPTDADGVAREVLKVDRRFYFGDFGWVSGVADPQGRRDDLQAAIESLKE